MKCTKGNETPLREQGQEPLSGRMAKSKGAGKRHPQMAVIRSFGGSAEGGQPFARGSRGMQSPWAESRGGSLWSVSRGETFGPGAERQRMLRCPEGETLWPRQD